MTPTLDDIRSLLEDAGAAQYGNECVSQLAHACQCALLAEQNDADGALITAALLHDIGHVVDKRFQQGQDRDVDRRHEIIGTAYLAKIFSPSVTKPIRLHVDAKRYLCFAEKGYFDTLSAASVRSLELQGGIYSPTDAVAFVAAPFAADAINLRKWDDLAKVPDLATPSLDHFMGYVEDVYQHHAA
tara:strand:+ start:170642 stop:171199 length:558 start_codon:yes stop_codon:yes gene_type:complete